ncbi:MAG: hypothetical protein A3A98_04150 [Candidatus Staskawiczbacteria bacterium RIFCSPLOWO2_01_FULL_40_39]|uniref:Uncharacterized protein n=1 Tax=Candidatus Staskawiczbacteria bacterium RIFCSPHIGHO2_01_FULL_39_25 TaxID=1802202 RepID=A0A1G2HNX8_9BACT|nr:MAG: hypothetical protein A2730_03365 [Candidatus Staskawiczbacteria bacterium RIFCSPHIGHO2_01_FULL_39_25]OGZ73960.1 MAG: hypothetical protein A3A98_04150 [Candidatus Staskawiczbacteria bacterium RIFCSPLOWO2_01_FULL_40_39]OGZ75364.1 MAG: hypothetical protein A3I87_02815 [Candidatus Staskawiczbacteria bacterium RIFCSPLOWO2_02_FULL_39_8]
MQKRKEVRVNFKEGFKKLADLEVQYDLFSIFYEGIPLWLYARDRALNIISGITSYEGQSISSHAIRPVNLVKRVFYCILNFYKIFNNDIIIFTNERHLEKDLQTGEYYNPFAELAVRQNPNAKKFLIFEFPIPMTVKYQKVNYQNYMLLDVFLFFRQIFSPLSLFYYRKIKKVFEPKFKASGLFTESEIKELLRRCYYSAYSMVCYGIFLKFIKATNPHAKLIYSCMGGYDKFPGVIEIQPALIIDNQSVYIYPETKYTQNYLKTKKMIVFSEHAKDLLAKNGYTQENISVQGNSKIKFYFIKNINDTILKKVEKVDNKIVIIGNWGGSFLKIIKNLVLDIEKNNELFKNWDISLVLHPAEDNTYKKLHLTKVKVFENHQVSLWGMLSEAVATINIASTVLEESTYFGCYNIILKDIKFSDQTDFVNALCGSYPYKAIVDPEKFIHWFEENQSNIKNHAIQKNKIIKENYEYFLKN